MNYVKDTDFNFDEEGMQNHYFKPGNAPKVSRKTTINNGPRPRSLDNKDFECELDKDSDKNLSNKKSKHYEQVMASYKSLKGPMQSDKNLKASCYQTEDEMHSNIFRPQYLGT